MTIHRLSCWMKKTRQYPLTLLYTSDSLSFEIQHTNMEFFFSGDELTLIANENENGLTIQKNQIEKVLPHALYPNSRLLILLKNNASLSLSVDF